MDDMLFERRSIRKYVKDSHVTTEQLDYILHAAMLSPSANNRQPWEFLVADDKELLDKIAAIHPYAKMLPSAGCGIIVLGKNDVAPGFWPVDCAAATTTILYAATSLGLGSCWCGLYPREERMEPVSSLLSLPENLKPFSLIVLGVPDEKKAVPLRYDPKRIHRNGL
ncbi:MAG: nitroreductase family protein [Eubacteriales bacterium]